MSPGLTLDNVNTPSTPAPSASNSGNLLERLLPTAGAVAGGTLGAIAGLPGDLFTGGGASLAAGVGGATAGGTAGRALENLFTHQNVKDDLGSTAVESGVGQLAGAGLGGLLKGGGGILGGLGTKAASDDAAAGSEEALSNAFPDAALNAAQRKSLNFGQSLDLADQAGIDKTPEGFLQAQGAATGANGVLNGTLDKLVADSGPVDLNGFGDIVNGALKDNTGVLGSVSDTSGVAKGAMSKISNPATTVQQHFEDMLQDIGYNGEGALDGQADPNNALDLLRAVGNAAQKFSGASDTAPGTAQAAQEDVYNKVYQGLKQMIYQRPEVDTAVSSASLTPEDEAAVLKATGGNQQLTDYLTNTVNNAQRASDITKVESQFVNMGKAGQRTLDFTNNAVGTGATASAARATANRPSRYCKKSIIRWSSHPGRWSSSR